MIYVKNFIKWSLLIGGMIFWFFVTVGIIVNQPEGHVYDCSIAEISPDIPLEVKEECRRLQIVKRRTEA